MTMPAMTLKGVLSMLGVLRAASRRPSMASSSMSIWNTRGMFTVSRIATNPNASGSQPGFCMNRR